MTAANHPRPLTAAEVLQRYLLEDPPAFVGVDLEDANQVDSFGERPLHVAAARGNTEEILAFLEAGADVNAPGEFGDTPLIEAIVKNKIDAAELLLRYGALPEKANELGWTAFAVARQWERIEILRLLKVHTQSHKDAVPHEEEVHPHRMTAAEVLERYVDEWLPSILGFNLQDVNQVCLFNERPLHIAASRGNKEEILALIEGGADINAPGEFGHTPLHGAVSQGHVEAVKLLLKHGASPNTRNEWGQTPYDSARRSGRDEILKLLLTAEEERK